MRSLAKNREILADSAPTHAAGCNLMHTIICATRRCTPLYSGAHYPVN